MTDYEYVVSRWALTHRCDGSYRGYARGAILIQEKHGEWTEFPNWSAAAEFTRQCERELAELDAEIERSSALVWDEEDWVDWMEYHTKGDAGYEPGEVTTVVRQQCADIRTLARLRSIRAGMAKGWKESK